MRPQWISFTRSNISKATTYFLRWIMKQEKGIFQNFDFQFSDNNLGLVKHDFFLSSLPWVNMIFILFLFIFWIRKQNDITNSHEIMHNNFIGKVSQNLYRNYNSSNRTLAYQTCASRIKKEGVSVASKFCKHLWFNY